jgi:hypothetical protein
MIEGLLIQERLDAVRAALREVRRREAYRVLMVGLVVVACGLIGFGGLKSLFGYSILASQLFITLGLGLCVGLVERWVNRVRCGSVEVAREIEAAMPELDARLLTAVAVLEKKRKLDEVMDFLERRVVVEALNAGSMEGWLEGVIGDRLKVLGRWNAVLGCLVFGLFVWASVMGEDEGNKELGSEEVLVERAADGAVVLRFEVKPGAVEVERDSRLVVEAKVSPVVPREARLVWMDAAGVELGSAGMAVGVDGVTFGGMIGRVDREMRYRVEAEGQRSAEFAVTTFVYPKLERLDVVVVPPAYTGLPVRELKNVLKVAAPEGSVLKFKARVNKPVVSAELFASEEAVVVLKPGAGGALVLEGELKLEVSGRYRLHLVDEKERGNVKPPWVVLTAQPNALAKIEVVFPKRDLQVSALQELPVEARVWDDVGVSRSGATVTFAGESKEVVFDHAATGPNQKEAVKAMLDLEPEGVMPRQLVSYHFWAEDAGPKGEVRRAMSDMFFAQVREFEDIFRETESPPPEPGMPEEKAGKLVELQKQVVNANWRVVRDTAGGKKMEEAVEDVAVVRESEAITLEQTKAEMEKAEDAEVKQALTEAWKGMREALDALQKAEEGQRAALMQAQEHEQSALQWLYQASEREHLVARQDPKAKSSGGAPKEKDEQLMNLELKQEEQRYEQEKTAQAEQSAEQKESLEVLNKLKELARRQEALAKKMQELREQMAQAGSEAEKEELRDQLDRLQEEQEDLLRGLDDLNEKLAGSERAADMEETRKELEAVREQALESAEKLKEENLADAANAATRAERDLKALEEDFREKSARRFSEEMKGIKRDVQAVAEAQKKISEGLENQKTPEGAERGDTSNALDRMLSGSEAAKALVEQQDRVEKLMEQLKGVSEQAEGAEPILSRKLYEAVRGAQTGGLEEHLEEARMQSRYGDRAAAQEAERKAATAVEKLAKQVDSAAEAVLGSEAEGLRMARNELDRLIGEVAEEGEKAEVAEGKGDEGKGDKEGKGEGKQAGEVAEGKGEKGEGGEAGKGEATGKVEEGKGGQMAGAKGEGEGQGKGEGKGEGQGEGGKVAEGKGQGGGRGGQAGNARSGGGGEWFFDEAGEVPRQGPFSGDGYREWAERLSLVEELVGDPELANEAARVADAARALKLEHGRNNEAPQAATLQARITMPLLELRNRVNEALARKGAQDPTVPIDRDAVPPAFRDLVRRYYTELGGGN